MSTHNSDNEKLEPGPSSSSSQSVSCKPTNDNSNITVKCKYNKKRKIDETDFSVMTTLELIQFLS